MCMYVLSIAHMFYTFAAVHHQLALGRADPQRHNFVLQGKASSLTGSSVEAKACALESRPIALYKIECQALGPSEGAQQLWSGLACKAELAEEQFTVSRPVRQPGATPLARTFSSCLLLLGLQSLPLVCL